MINHMVRLSSQLRRLTRYFCVFEAEERELRKFADVWRQCAFIAWEKESVRKSKKTLQLRVQLITSTACALAYLPCL